MLADAQFSTRLPAKNLERARQFYSEKLGIIAVRVNADTGCHRPRSRRL
jgi:hypothetical protein